MTFKSHRKSPAEVLFDRMYTNYYQFFSVRDCHAVTSNSAVLQFGST